MPVAIRVSRILSRIKADVSESLSILSRSEKNCYFMFVHIEKTQYMLNCNKKMIKNFVSGEYFMKSHTPQV